jgi:hypothetical protein
LRVAVSGGTTNAARSSRRLGAVAIHDGELFAVGAITVAGGKIVEIDILANPEPLRRLDLTILDD